MWGQRISFHRCMCTCLADVMCISGGMDDTTFVSCLCGRVVAKLAYPGSSPSFALTVRIAKTCQLQLPASAVRPRMRLAQEWISGYKAAVCLIRRLKGYWQGSGICRCDSPGAAPFTDTSRLRTGAGARALGQWHKAVTRAVPHSNC